MKKSRIQLEAEKERIEKELEQLEVKTARDIIGKYDENWTSRNDIMDEELDSDLYISVDELKIIENLIQNSRITSYSKEQVDDILCDAIRRLQNTFQ